MYLQGEKLSEVYQQFGEWAGQVIRLYSGAKHFEIEWTVGPINVRFVLALQYILTASCTF